MQPPPDEVLKPTRSPLRSPRSRENNTIPGSLSRPPDRDADKAIRFFLHFPKSVSQNGSSRSGTFMATPYFDRVKSEDGDVYKE
jgi:hypothetical protein